MIQRMLKWVRREEGQGMVEYGLILALVAVVVIGALVALGGGVKDKFNQVNTEITQQR